MSADAEANGDGASDAEEGTVLDEPFVVTASGPVEYHRPDRAAEGVEEVLNITVEIERELPTAEAFEHYYDRRNNANYLHDAIALLIVDCDGYVVRRKHLGDWEFEVDGPVAAYFGVADAVADGVSRHFREVLPKDCADSELFGPGAAIAVLAARRDAGKDTDFGWAAERFGEGGDER